MTFCLIIELDGKFPESNTPLHKLQHTLYNVIVM